MSPWLNQVARINKIKLQQNLNWILKQTNTHYPDMLWGLLELLLICKSWYITSASQLINLTVSGITWHHDYYTQTAWSPWSSQQSNTITNYYLRGFSGAWRVPLSTPAAPSPRTCWASPAQHTEAINQIIYQKTNYYQIASYYCNFRHNYPKHSICASTN
jgi:hypothetical protein